MLGCLEFGVKGLGFRVYGLGLRVWSLGFWAIQETQRNGEKEKYDMGLQSGSTTVFFADNQQVSGKLLASGKPGCIWGLGTLSLAALEGLGLGSWYQLLV